MRIDSTTVMESMIEMYSTAMRYHERIRVGVGSNKSFNMLHETAQLVSLTNSISGIMLANDGVV